MMIERAARHIQSPSQALGGNTQISFLIEGIESCAAGLASGTPGDDTS
jgi:hypothetical protein